MKLNVTEGKPNPLQILYPTPIWLGYLDINKEKLIDLAEWARTQKWENVGNTPIFTTRGGEQYITPRPIWEYDYAPGINELMPQIKQALNEWLAAMTGQTCYEPTPQGSQFVFYEPGGHQWPHWHHSTWTSILGLRNRGTLLIQDPRPLATTNGCVYKEIIINPGQLFISPGYLVHSSVPSQDERDILVFTGN